MREQQQQSGDMRQSFRQFVGWCESFAYLGEAWMRVPGTPGAKYFAGRAFIAWAILLVIASFGNSEHLFIFWAATGGCMLLHALVHARRYRKGRVPPHSRFVGVSGLSFLGGNRLAIRLWEPAVFFVGGLELIKNGYGVGGFAVILAMCMFVSGSHAVAAANAKVTALNDAKAEQQWLSEVTSR